MTNLIVTALAVALGACAGFMYAMEAYINAALTALGASAMLPLTYKPKPKPEPKPRSEKEILLANLREALEEQGKLVVSGEFELADRLEKTIETWRARVKAIQAEPNGEGP